MPRRCSDAVLAVPAATRTISHVAYSVDRGRYESCDRLTGNNMAAIIPLNSINLCSKIIAD